MDSANLEKLLPSKISQFTVSRSLCIVTYMYTYSDRFQHSKSREVLSVFFLLMITNCMMLCIITTFVMQCYDLNSDLMIGMISCYFMFLVYNIPF